MINRMQDNLDRVPACHSAAAVSRQLRHLVVTTNSGTAGTAHATRRPPTSSRTTPVQPDGRGAVDRGGTAPGLRVSSAARPAGSHAATAGQAAVTPSFGDVPPGRGYRGRQFG